jgi:hypothetical protein
VTIPEVDGSGGGGGEGGAGGAPSLLGPVVRDAAAKAAGAVGVPQLRQNADPAGSAVPHFTQNWPAMPDGGEALEITHSPETRVCKHDCNSSIDEKPGAL